MTATSFTLKWQPSEYDGGAKIIEYVVEMREDGSTKWKKIGASKGDITDIPVSNLKKDQAYYFKIYARNEIGMSDAFLPEDRIVAGQRLSKSSEIVVTFTNKKHRAKISSLTISAFYFAYFNAFLHFFDSNRKSANH